MMRAPTPYPEVNEILDILHSKAAAILGDGLVGMALYGSLSSGDFDLRHSDIDFVVITADELGAPVIDELQSMHEQLWAGPLKWSAKLEGSYISKRALRRFSPDGRSCPQVNEGRFYVEPHGADWVIQRYILRECGVVISGPPLADLIDPVSPDDLRGASREVLLKWWEPMLRDASFLQQDGYRAFAIQTMCRVLYTQRHGTVTSKPVSMRWALAEGDPRWSPILERALAWVGDSTVAEVSEVQDFIRYTIEMADV